jgi:hypothetical protein
VKAASLAAVGAAAMLTTAWTEATPTPGVPECSAEQMKRGAVIYSGTTPYGGPLYIRFCGPARIVVRQGSRRWEVPSGRCTSTEAGRIGGRRVTIRNVMFGVLTNAPAPNLVGVAFWWDVARKPRPVTVNDGSFELPGFAPGPGFPTVTSAGPNGGTFVFPRSHPRVTGRWTCL